MDIRNSPKVIWFSILIGIISLSISILEIYEGEFQLNDTATLADTILAILAFCLVFRSKFIYFLYVSLIGLKVIAGIALSVLMLYFSNINEELNQTAILWIGGITLFWLAFYIALRRPNVKEWYKTGSSNKLQPSTGSAG